MACVTKKRGRWAVDFYDHEGRRRLKMALKGATKAQAKKLLREIEDQLERGVYRPARDMPRFKAVAEDWLEFKRPNVRASTWKMYGSHLTHHFTDIDPIKINRITIAQVERFITERMNAKMNITTLRKVLVTFNQVMNYAVRHRYIDHNPVREAEKPRGQGKEQKSKIRVLVPAEVGAFLNAVTDIKHKILFMLAIMSGARQGELFGLKWTDVDWVNSQVQIKRTFNNGAWYQPKSAASTRRIDLGPAMMAELKQWRLACLPSDLDLVFPSKAGTPLDHGHVISREFQPALKLAGLPRIRFHDLRHTYASLLIEQGENIKYIQSQLGHSSPSVTLNIYAHLLKPSNQQAAKRLESTIFGGSIKQAHG